MSANEVLWTVVRFANGSWGSGGRPKDYAEYEGHEIFQVMATSREKATKKAQAKRSRDLKKPKPTA